jgi:hypothetical protein
MTPMRLLGLSSTRIVFAAPAGEARRTICEYKALANSYHWRVGITSQSEIYLQRAAHFDLRALDAKNPAGKAINAEMAQAYRRLAAYTEAQSFL